MYERPTVFLQPSLCCKKEVKIFLELSVHALLQNIFGFNAEHYLFFGLFLLTERNECENRFLLVLGNQEI
jgi:hypothetical protein